MNPKHVIMIASEDASLRGGKVGGVGDVLQELPLALGALGWHVTVFIPSYGFLHLQNPATRIGTVDFPFRAHRHTAEFWEAEAHPSHPSVRHIIVHHPWISGEPIYFNDPSDQPFARDASKYALVCSAVGQYLINNSVEGVLHLHDWHAATLLLLRDVHPQFSDLKKYKTIYTIHNLGIQGTRPMQHHDSSVEAWFPELFTSTDWLPRWIDPRHQGLYYTPMLAGIRFSYAVNTVSESYAEEILLPNHRENGFFGGEGLEMFLQQTKSEGRLIGILNGCSYSVPRHSPLAIDALFKLIAEEVEARRAELGGLPMEDGLNKLKWLLGSGIKTIITGVTRVTEQKIRLLCEKDSSGKLAIESISKILSENNGVYILLGTGTADYEQYLSEASRYLERFIFVRGFSETVANALYSSGTMYLMPSLYEPCGISQMLAMREGQPCIVHRVGGLKDTVQHDVNGFCFEGWTLLDKVNNLVAAVAYAVSLATNDRTRWEKIKQVASSARFDWGAAAKKYEKLYEL